MNAFSLYRMRSFACVMLGVMFGVVACENTPDPYTASLPYPPDLAITVFIDTPWDDDSEAVETRSYYVLLPDRTLHAAYGPGVSERLFPPPTAVVSPDAMRELWFIIDEHQLWNLQAKYGKLQTAHGAKRKPSAIVSRTEQEVTVETQTVERTITEQTEQVVVQGVSVAPDVLEITDGDVQPAYIVQYVTTPQGVEEVSVANETQTIIDTEVDVTVNTEIEAIVEPVDETQSVTYRVQIIAYDKFYDYALPMQDSQGTQELIRKLAELRGWTHITPAQKNALVETETVNKTSENDDENNGDKIDVDVEVETESQTVIEAN